MDVPVPGILFQQIFSIRAPIPVSNEKQFFTGSLKSFQYNVHYFPALSDIEKKSNRCSSVRIFLISVPPHLQYHITRGHRHRLSVPLLFHTLPSHSPEYPYCRLSPHLHTSQPSFSENFRKALAYFPHFSRRCSNPSILITSRFFKNNRYIGRKQQPETPNIRITSLFFVAFIRDTISYKMLWLPLASNGTYFKSAFL